MTDWMEKNVGWECDFLMLRGPGHDFDQEVIFSAVSKRSANISVINYSLYQRYW